MIKRECDISRVVKSWWTFTLKNVFYWTWHPGLCFTPSSLGPVVMSPQQCSDVCLKFLFLYERAPSNTEPQSIAPQPLPRPHANRTSKDLKRLFLTGWSFLHQHFEKCVSERGWEVLFLATLCKHEAGVSVMWFSFFPPQVSVTFKVMGQPPDTPVTGVLLAKQQMCL